MKRNPITALFLDIGGILLSNGWGHESRIKAVNYFKLDGAELDKRHQLTFDTYEEGKLTLNEYLKKVIFYKTRAFSLNDFKEFMFNQSSAYPDSIIFFKEIKRNYGLKVIAVSNEGRELNAFRVKKFKLNELFDAYVSSSFVHLRKPDADIFRMASDISQTMPEHTLYIDDGLMFVKVAKTLGMHGIHYQSLEAAKKQLKAFGFEAKD
jgi:putative hydrolase of the HAD superfamily